MLAYSVRWTDRPGSVWQSIWLNVFWCIYHSCWSKIPRISLRSLWASHWHYYLPGKYSQMYSYVLEIKYTMNYVGGLSMTAFLHKCRYMRDGILPIRNNILEMLNANVSLFNKHNWYWDRYDAEHYNRLLLIILIFKTEKWRGEG